jgi:hypothetical protein
MKRIIKKKERPLCPVCQTRMLPAGEDFYDDNGIKLCLWLCNCKEGDHKNILFEVQKEVKS